MKKLSGGSEQIQPPDSESLNTAMEPETARGVTLELFSSRSIASTSRYGGEGEGVLPICHVQLVISETDAEVGTRCNTLRGSG